MRTSEEQLNLLETITMEVAATTDLSCALEVVLHRVCEKTGWALGQAWVPSQDGTVLECGPVWYGEETDLKSFRAASLECHFVPGIGLPGRVWKSKKPAWVEDVRNDPNFPRMEAARVVGLRTGVGIPILLGDHVIAVIEFFMHESRNANERLVKVIAAVAAQLDLVMERKRAADELAQTNEILQSVLSNMGDAVIVADTEGKFLLFNPMAERMFGMGATRTGLSEWSNRYGLYLPDKVTLFPNDQLPLTRSIRGEEVNDVEMFVRHATTPHGLWTRISGRPLRDPDGNLLGGVIVCRDITQIKEEELLRAGQSRVLEMIAADASLTDVLTNLVLLMEGQAEGLRCSILLLDRDGKRVRHGAAPNLPDAYVKEVDGAAIGPRNGSCGTAMYTRRPVVVTDVLTDPLWADYRGLAKICGLCACWSTPILSAKGEVLGSFAMYRQEKRGPRSEETRLTEIATHIAGIAIERQQQQEILREREARISLAAESAELAFLDPVSGAEQRLDEREGTRDLWLRFRPTAHLRPDSFTDSSGRTSGGDAGLRSGPRLERDFRERASHRPPIWQDALGHNAWAVFAGRAWKPSGDDWCHSRCQRAKASQSAIAASTRRDGSSQPRCSDGRNDRIVRP